MTRLEDLLSRYLSPSNVCVEGIDDLGFPIPRVRYSRFMPHPGGQAAVLCDPARDVFLGGGGGGAKSMTLLMDALQFCDVPGYSALFLRRTYSDLVLPGAALDVAHDMLDGYPGVEWKDKTKSFVFDTGTPIPATLTYGHLSSASAHERYRGAELQFCAIDEVSNIPERAALFPFQRLRKPRLIDGAYTSPDGLSLADVPLRYRAAANPGGIHMDWVRARYIDPATRNPRSVHYHLTRVDNPTIDFDQYAESLSFLPEVEMRRMLFGDWTVTSAGQFLDASRIVHVDSWPRGGRLVRYWDCAATEDLGGNDPDWTVGMLGTFVDGALYIIDVARHRWGAGDVESNIARYALTDPPGTECHWEQEPGSNSKILSATRRATLSKRGVLTKAWTMSGQGSKAARARLVVPTIEHGNVRAVVGTGTPPEWLRPFLAELGTFDGTDVRGRHDDIVDGLSGLHRALVASAGIRVMTRSSDRAAAIAERDAQVRAAAEDPTVPPTAPTPPRPRIIYPTL